MVNNLCPVNYSVELIKRFSGLNSICLKLACTGRVESRVTVKNMTCLIIRPENRPVRQSVHQTVCSNEQNVLHRCLVPSVVTGQSFRYSTNGLNINARKSNSSAQISTSNKTVW